MVSPFLTNDGVCLLFVEPILKAFDNIVDDDTNIESDEISLSPDLSLQKGTMKLKREDAFYFMLALACSSNIGSTLTYTGNPQNMIIAQDSIDVLPPYAFFAYMIIPSLVAWGITIHCIQCYWLKQRDDSQEALQNASKKRDKESGMFNSCLCYENHPQEVDILVAQAEAEQKAALDALSPRSKAKVQAQSMKNSITNTIADYIVASPFPFAMLILMFAMIVLIFCGI